MSNLLSYYETVKEGLDEATAGRASEIVSRLEELKQLAAKLDEQRQKARTEFAEATKLIDSETAKIEAELKLILPTNPVPPLTIGSPPPDIEGAVASLSDEELERLGLQRKA